MVTRDLRAMYVCHAAVLVDYLVCADRWPKDEALRAAPSDWPSVQAGPDQDKLEVDSTSYGIGLLWYNPMNTLRQTIGVPILSVLSGIASAHFLRNGVFEDLWQLAVTNGLFWGKTRF